MARLPTGGRIREQRRKCRLTQAALAASAGISTSYLNLIEHDKRPIGGALLNRLAAALGVDASHLSGVETARLAQDVLELARTYGGNVADETQALDFVANSPDWARAFLQLHRRYQDANATAHALADRLSQDSALVELSHAVLTRITSIRSFAEILEKHPDLEPGKRLRFSRIIATEAERLGSGARAMMELLGAAPGSTAPASPDEEVDDFIRYHNNYFPALEDAADRLRQELTGPDRTLTTAIAGRLTDRHGAHILLSSAEVTAHLPDAFMIRFDEGISESSRRFALARHLVECEYAGLLAALTADERLITTAEARSRCRRALANYTAAALLFPYEAFLSAAETWRYDIRRLAHQFGGSFEQAAQRLVSLRRPGAEGIPFTFLRSDPAGNLSKRFSILGLRMPRFGGACPLWPLYAAFRSPGRTVAQIVEMPEGERYLLVARCVSKRMAGFRQPETLFSIMVGCDAIFSDRTVYGEGLAPKAIPAGFGCRSCSRTDCRQRAYPSISAANRQEARLDPSVMS